MGIGFEYPLDYPSSVLDQPEDVREAVIVMLKYSGYKEFSDEEIGHVYEVADDVARKMGKIGLEAVRDRVIGRISTT